MALPQRREIILKIVVGEYIASATPVASESIARSYALGISPATARNEIAHLEEEGYIIRPHVSAGGVPSNKGYRYYVECLLKEAKLSDEEQLAIQQLFNEAGLELEEWARLAAGILAQRAKTIALVTLPRAPQCRFRHLDLITLQEFLVLLMLVLQGGGVKKQLFALEQAISQDELIFLTNRLNKVYKGLTHSQISNQELELSLFGEQVTMALLQMMEAEDKQQQGQFYLDGWRHLVSQPEFMKDKKMLGLVEALEERSIINNLLDSLVDELGVKVTIGNENREEALQECSVILSNYGALGRRGALGIIGPTRMPYSQAIPTVDYLSSIMSGLVSEIYV